MAIIPPGILPLTGSLGPSALKQGLGQASSVGGAGGLAGRFNELLGGMLPEAGQGGGLAGLQGTAAPQGFAAGPEGLAGFSGLQGIQAGGMPELQQLQQMASSLPNPTRGLLDAGENDGGGGDETNLFASAMRLETMTTLTKLQGLQGAPDGAALARAVSAALEGGTGGMAGNMAGAGGGPLQAQALAMASRAYGRNAASAPEAPALAAMLSGKKI